MSNITIPPEALEAARVAWLESASDYNRLDDSIRAACLAMIENWPNGSAELSDKGNPHIILPLQEDQNDKA